MTGVRYIVGALGFLLVGLLTAVLVGAAMFMLFPSRRHVVVAGIGLDWRNIPGTVLGLLAGWQSFRASVSGTKGKQKGHSGQPPIC